MKPIYILLCFTLLSTSVLGFTDTFTWVTEGVYLNVTEYGCQSTTAYGACLENNLTEPLKYIPNEHHWAVCKYDWSAAPSCTGMAWRLGLGFNVGGISTCFFDQPGSTNCSISPMSTGIGSITYRRYLTQADIGKNIKCKFSLWNYGDPGGDCLYATRLTTGLVVTTPSTTTTQITTTTITTTTSTSSTQITTTTTLPTCVGTEVSSCLIYENDRTNCEAGHYTHYIGDSYLREGYYQCDFGEICYHHTACEPREPIEPPSYNLVYVIILIIVVILAYSMRKKKKKRR